LFCESVLGELSVALPLDEVVAAAEEAEATVTGAEAEAEAEAKVGARVGAGAETADAALDAEEAAGADCVAGAEEETVEAADDAVCARDETGGVSTVGFAASTDLLTPTVGELGVEVGAGGDAEAADPGAGTTGVPVASVIGSAADRATDLGTNSLEALLSFVVGGGGTEISSFVLGSTIGRRAVWRFSGSTGCGLGACCC